MKTKQVIIIANYLNMRKGKMIAQGSHASEGFIVESLFIKEFDGKKYFCFEYSEFWEHWFKNYHPKIVLGVDSEKTLLEIQNICKEKNVPSYLVVDNGKTEFNNIKTITALAIGPYLVDDIDYITGSNGVFKNNLKLL